MNVACSLPWLGLRGAFGLRFVIETCLFDRSSGEGLTHVGWELIVGYLAAWVIRKAKRAGQRADTEVDRVVDLAMERLHDVVSARLGRDPAVERLRQEANEGGTTPLTRQRVQLALQAASADDPAFGHALDAAAIEVQRAERESGRSVVTAAGDNAVAVTGNTTIHADRGSVAALNVSGDAVVGSGCLDPSRPGPSND